MLSPYSDPGNDNHRTWLDGVAASYPGRLMLVSFVLSVLAGMVLFSALARWLNT